MFEFALSRRHSLKLALELSGCQEKASKSLGVSLLVSLLIGKLSSELASWLISRGLPPAGHGDEL